MPDTHPLTRTVELRVAAVGTANATLNTPAHVVPFAATVTSVQYVADSGITGAATNNRAVALVNKGAAGSGTTSVAAKAYASGVNATALVPDTITLSGTAANLVLAAGDVLRWESTPNGTGATDPGGLIRITYSRN